MFTAMHNDIDLHLDLNRPLPLTAMFTTDAARAGASFILSRTHWYRLGWTQRAVVAAQLPCCTDTRSAQGRVRLVSHRNMSQAADDASENPAPVMWFRATDRPEAKPLHPDWRPSKPAAQFDKFSSADSDRLERAFQAGKSHETVQQDGLYTVDFDSRIYRPTFWLGPEFRVVRGTWFIQTGMKPLPEKLADKIERAWRARKSEIKDLGDGRAVKFDYASSPPIATLKNDDWIESVKNLRIPSNQRLVRGYNRSAKVSDSLRTAVAGLAGLGKSQEASEGDDNAESQAKAAKEQTMLGKAVAATSEMGDAKGESNNQKDIKDGEKGEAEKASAGKEPARKHGGPDRKVDHLVFCIHGIGQQLNRRFESISFVKDVNALRDGLWDTFQSSDALQRAVPDKHNHGVQVLPVLWRQSFKFGGSHIHPSLAEVAPQAMFAARDNLIADVVLDFVMYTQEQLRDLIQQTVIDVMNKQYREFCELHPDFKANPRVSILSHSLGGVIANDLLRKESTKLDFDPEYLFLLGTPLGALDLLHGTPFTMDGLRAKSVYNVMRTSDPVATRLEPLVTGKAVEAAPKQLPEATGSLLAQVKSWTDDLSSVSSSITSGASSIVKLLTSQLQDASTKKVEESNEPLDRKTADDLSSELKQFNRHARLDFALPEAIDVSVLIGIAGHLTYLESPEVASFVLHELLGVNGLTDEQPMRSKLDAEDNSDATTNRE